MTLVDIVSFFVPDFSDPLQGIFFGVMFSMLVLPAIFVCYFASEKKWEKQWAKVTVSKSGVPQGIEQAGVTEAAHMVATRHEKIADLMPGLLLIVGLLGTFIGLGLALDKASTILGASSALDAAGAANSMQNMLGMLQGLGTKFKTSTWGILGFILFQVFNAVVKYDEKRLNWVLGKLKQEAEIRHDKELALEAEAKARQEAEAAASWEKIESLARKIAKAFVDVSEKTSRDIIEENRIIMNSVVDGLERVTCASEKTSGAMASFTDNTQRLIAQMDGSVEKMSEAATGMNAGAKGVGAAAQDLSDAVDQFKAEFASVLNDVSTNLAKAIDDMSKTASETLSEGSRQLGESTQKIGEALNNLSEDVKQTMEQVQQSIAKAEASQAATSVQFETTVDHLKDTLGNLNGVVEKMSEPIKTGLTAISSSNRSLGGAVSAINKQLDILGQKLSEMPDEIKREVVLSKFTQLLGQLETCIAQLPVNEGVESSLTTGFELDKIGAV